MTLIVHAPNVHHGGGRTLLLSVLNAAAAQDSIALLDARLDTSSLPPDLVLERFRPTLLGRWNAERRVRRLSQPGDTVLCFGNLPPLFRNKGRVVVFLQNRYLFGQRDLRAFAWRDRWRIRLERYWFSQRLDTAAMQVYVQTASMADELLRETGVVARVFPFIPTDTPSTSDPGRVEPPEFDFIYVASGEPHKNHRQLIDAWTLLGTQGAFPSLCLTLDPQKHTALLHHLQQAQERHGLRITNLGTVAPADMARCYQRSRALIYPSTLESFGLPLIEAAQRGLPILASEKDYVRDVVTPAESFDPNSPLSIARAVSRFLRQNQAPRPVLSGAAFLSDVIGATTPPQSASK
ncbi:glycosyltransferase [Hydrogenophaga sp. SNF1]|uniref:glycosyltransferase n=1 Tax=Hydrogenophaga sp. SNF1 TaxID=3098762 RepID=UPI002ACC30A8|nr:glycosyltransferase [Hydrogenophaga sp. SNF1]WQB83972.1 glycosyltransferase [Hydrogenophaga sp. SNF1]